MGKARLSASERRDVLFDGINPGFFVCHRGESFARMIRASYLPCHFAVIIRGLMLPPLYLRAQCCVMMLYRVSGEGGREDGIWVSRVNHSPRTSTAYIYLLYAFVARICNSCHGGVGRIAARISRRRSFIFTPRFVISRSRYKNFEASSTKLVRTSFLRSRG